MRSHVTLPCFLLRAWRRSWRRRRRAWRVPPWRKAVSIFGSIPFRDEAPERSRRRRADRQDKVEAIGVEVLVAGPGRSPLPSQSSGAAAAGGLEGVLAGTSAHKVLFHVAGFSLRARPRTY
jgi:hypothetical protein